MAKGDFLEPVGAAIGRMLARHDNALDFVLLLGAAVSSYATISIVRKRARLVDDHRPSRGAALTAALIATLFWIGWIVSVANSASLEGA